MTFDVLLSPTARSFVNSLNPDERHAFDHCLALLCSNPFPDGETKVRLPPMYRPGVLGFGLGEFWIVYEILNGPCVQVHAAYWTPEARRYRLG